MKKTWWRLNPLAEEGIEHITEDVPESDMELVEKAQKITSHSRWHEVGEMVNEAKSEWAKEQLLNERRRLYRR